MRFRHLFLITSSSDEARVFSRVFPSIPTHIVPSGELGPIRELYPIWKRLQALRIQGSMRSEAIQEFDDNLEPTIAHYRQLAVGIARQIFPIAPAKGNGSNTCFCIHDPSRFEGFQEVQAYLDFLLEIFHGACILFPTGRISTDPSALTSTSEVDVSSPHDPSERYLREYARLKPDCAISISRDLFASESPFHRQERQMLASFLGLDLIPPVPEIARSESKRLPSQPSARDPNSSCDGLSTSSEADSSTELLAAIDTFLATFPKRPLLTQGLICFREALGANAQQPRSEQRPPSSRIVWSYWDDGESNAPEVVRLCFSRWRQLNPDYSIRILSKSDLAAVFSDWDRFASLPVAAFSDLLRIHLLASHGGVWTDATVLPLIPLRLWLPSVLRSGFFAFSQGVNLTDPNPTTQATVASWFLAAEPNSLIATRWYAAAKTRCQDLVSNPPSRKPLSLMNGKAIDRIHGDEYWWFHQEFTKILASDPEFGDQWSHCYWWPMQIPHLLGTRRHALQTHTDRPRGQLLRKRLAPLLKLSAKYDVMRTVRQYRILDETRFCPSQTHPD